MSFNHEQLVFKALVALSEFVEQSRTAPVKPSGSLRFVLAWLYVHSNEQDSAIYNEFWQTVQKGSDQAYSECQANYMRGTNAQTIFMGIARRAGVELTPQIECQLYQARMTKVEREQYLRSPHHRFANHRR